MSDTAVTPVGRASFVNVWKPKKDQNGNEKFNVTLLIPKTEDCTVLKNIIASVIAEKWPEGAPPNLTLPVKDGDTDMMQDGTLRRAKYPEMAGHWIMNASTNRQPKVVDHNVQPVLDQSALYSGCYVRLSVRAYPYFPNAKRPQSKIGVGIGLNHVQVVRPGEPLGAGNTRPEDDFAPIAGEATAPVAPPPGTAAPAAPAPANPFGGAPAAPPPAAPPPATPGFFG